jgi:photosystem II PsbZ protein
VSTILKPNLIFEETDMITIIQLLVSALILLSFVLIIGVPVILVSPGEWEKSKNLVYASCGLWFGLVIVTAAFNNFVI